MSRWSRAERVQRRQHRPFRIAAPRWSPDDRTRLAALLDELSTAVETAKAPDTSSNTPAEQALAGRELATAVTNLWKARRRIEVFNQQGPKETKRIGRDLVAAEKALTDAGLVIQDHEGTKWDPGLSLEVVAFQEDATLHDEVVLRTVRPSVYLAGRRIQMGQVIVGCPIQADTPTNTAEETHA